MRGKRKICQFCARLLDIAQVEEPNRTRDVLLHRMECVSLMSRWEKIARYKYLKPTVQTRTVVFLMLEIPPYRL